MDYLDILRERSVSESTLERLKNEKIDQACIRAMTDAELSKFIPKYGDRLAVRQFMANLLQPEKKDNERLSLLEKLRHKLKRARDGEHCDEAPTTKASCKNALKEDRTIELGLMVFNRVRGEYVQVRSKNGGGIRKTKVPKSSKKDYILKIGKSLFFQAEGFSYGNESDYDFNLMDYKQVIMADDVTVENIIETTKLQKIRFYLSAFHKDENKTFRSYEPCTSSLPQQTEQCTYSRSSQNSVLASSADILLNPNMPPVQTSNTNNTQTSANVPTPSWNLSVSTVPPLSSTPSTSTAVNRIRLLDDDDDIVLPDLTPTNTHHEAPSSNRSPDVLFEDTLGEVQFLDQQLRIHDNANTPFEEKEVTLHRGHIFGELKHVFKQITDTDRCLLKLDLRLPNGEKESAEDNGGVMRDVLTEFWSTFYDRCTIGSGIKIPYLRHDMGPEDWTAICQILIYGWREQRCFPISISQAFMSYAMYGIDSFGANPKSLIPQFMEYLPKAEKCVLEKAVAGEFDLLEDIEDILTAHDCRKLPTADNIEQVLGEIAHKELIQQPSFVKICWHECFIRQNFQINNLDDAYSQLEPSAKKVIDNFKFPASMTSKEEEVSKFLKRYVRGLEQKGLENFLRYCTGSATMGVSVSGDYLPVSVRFVSLPGLTRRPVAHTCGRVLDLPREYEDFMDLRTEFNELFKSDIWIMDIV